MPAARAAAVRTSNPIAGLSLLLLLTVLGCGYIWASQAVLDEVTRGEGSVIPSSREQVIQSLEGGLLAEMRVAEGDIVEAGEVLLRIDDTRFNATFKEGQSRADALTAAIARLRAESEGGKLRLPAATPPDVAATERKLFNARREALTQRVAALGRSLELARDELRMTEPLVAKGVVSEVDVLRLRREVNELRGKIQDRRNEFRAAARAELSEKEGELNSATQLNTARADQVRRTIVRAPMRGTVKDIAVSTVGGVIGPGVEIMTIVPLEDRLLVEAKIKPADVAFLRPGLPASVKITAYDFAVYGGLDGTLEHISADTIVSTTRNEERYYRIRVSTEKASLSGPDGPLPIIPGMVATVEVLTGKKTVLDYLLKPVLRVRDSALKER
jgi:adhesin transport system membrane fusion protein